MTPVIAFLAGLVTTISVVFLALLYLRNPLQAILTDLCGSVERARFWTAFSNITLFLVPFALALDHQPAQDARQVAVFTISDQIESAIIGLVISVIFLGMVLSWHISRFQPAHTPNRASVSQADSQPGEVRI